MPVFYNMVTIIAIAILCWIGIRKAKGVEEYFVALGVLNIIYFICVLFYMIFNTEEFGIFF